ncbi:MAG: sulfurtransferase TusA family protein [Chthoniobacteraceae bacterium]
MTTQSSRIWNLPASLPEDLQKFQSMTSQFKEGTISATQYQVFRVPQGVYEQRENGSFMLRVRLPGGAVLAHQLRTLADAAAKYGNGVLHVTTRQDFQVHQVAVDSIQPALEQLAEAGLSTKGGGGNTVRNIIGCPHAGTCSGEAFDVTPHLIALTEYLLADQNSFQLPRKYKIAFSGCGNDCAGATVNDLGLIAKIKDGVEGFKVYVAGGLGSGSRVADVLEEFAAASDISLIAEAIKRVFYQHGNRKDKRQARIRYLVRQLGSEKFVQLYREELSELRRQAPATPALRPITFNAPAVTAAPVAEPDTESYRAWKLHNVKAQKQTGYNRVEIPLVLGDIASATLNGLADLVETTGEKSLRATSTQNLILRWVHDSELPHVFQELDALGLAVAQPAVLRRLVSCTGASTCKLGICLSRGLSKAIDRELTKSSVDLAALGDLSIHISGCPNSCGRHQIADIGLHGAARRVNDRLVPQYALQFGGHVQEGDTVLATGKHTLPARNVPKFLAELLASYEKAPAHDDFRAFLKNGGTDTVDALAEKYKPVPDFDEDKNFYYDWSADEPFSLAGRGPGECGAGVFDLIDVDLKSAAQSLTEGLYFKAVALAARALLVTRGEQAETDRDAFALFNKHFVQAGLANARFQPLLEAGESAAAAANPAGAFTVAAAEVTEFVTSIQNLFQSMDASLQFPKPSTAPAQPAPEAPKPVAAAVAADLEKDFRGIVCPLNYVKTKMALGTIKSGQVLSVLLDEAGARNVPESAAKDGNEILSVAQEAGAWRVIIRKG